MIRPHLAPGCAALAFLALAVTSSAQQNNPVNTGQQRPEAGKAVFERVCSSCHNLQIATASRRSRAQWQETMEAMVSKQGAKIPEDEFTPILNYLAAAYGRDANAPAPVAAPSPSIALPLPGGRGGRGGRGANTGGAGADDKHVCFDPVAADRGRKVYAAECITCHGTHARGSGECRGPGSLGGGSARPLRQRDRPVSTQGPPHPDHSGSEPDPGADRRPLPLYSLRALPNMRSALDIQNVLTGDPKAGAAYFNGAGKCSGCHSPTGDLAGVGGRYSPVNLQQRFLFPEGGGRGGRGGRSAPVTVTVTPPSGPAISGTLVALDDFNVALRDSSGDYHSFKRTRVLKVVKNDPFVAHEELLDHITDKQMHDVVAYLETLK